MGRRGGNGDGEKGRRNGCLIFLENNVGNPTLSYKESVTSRQSFVHWPSIQGADMYIIMLASFPRVPKT